MGKGHTIKYQGKMLDSEEDRSWEVVQSNTRSIHIGDDLDSTNDHSINAGGGYRTERC